MNYGDIIKNNEEIEISIVNGYTTKTLNTPKNDGYFSHYYQVEDANSTYAVLELDVTNKMESNLDVDSTFSVSALVDGKYEYTGFTVGLDESETNFDAFPSIDPNKTVKTYALIEIPDDVLDKGITFRINAFRKPYFVNLDK